MQASSSRGLIILCGITAIVLLAALGAPEAFGVIELNEDFDSGSLNVPLCSVSGSNVTLVPRKTSPGTYGVDWWWSLYFRADGVQGLTPQFQVANPIAGLKPEHRFVYSYDNQNWTYFDNGSVTGSPAVYNFSNNGAFTQDRVYVAIMPPFPASSTDAFVASVKGSPYVHQTVSGDANLVLGHTPGTAGGGYLDDMGRSVPSLPLYGFLVTDSSATGPKSKVVVAAGNHSGESLSQYVLEGLVNWLIGPAPEAALLRRSAEFYVYPSLDPEGRYAGYYVSNPQNPNLNHNRVWLEPSTNPEVVIIENAMRADTGSSVEYYLDMHVDWSDSSINGTPATQGSPFFEALKLRDPNYTARYTLLDSTDGYSQTWAQVPFAQGGLGAVYACTPEHGQIFNNSVDFLHQRGANFGLAFSDALKVHVPGNLAPVVSAGPDMKIGEPANTVSLAGTVSDDGQPDGASVTSIWTVVSGPGSVSFADPNAPATTATFQTTGTYVVRLTATDTDWAVHDDCIVIVAVNVAPTVNAGPNLYVRLPANSVSLDAAITDDGLPGGATITQTWSLVSGPGTVTFASANSVDTTATFSTAGTYILRLSASDTLRTGYDDCQVTVLTPDQLLLLMHLPLDEGAGTLAYDATGNGHNGTLRNGPLWITGARGKALQFDGVNDRVNVTDFALTSDFSVAFWFRRTLGAGPSYRYMFSWGTSSAVNSINVWIYEVGDGSASLRTDIQDVDGPSLVNNCDIKDTSIVNGQWHHYCATVGTGAGLKIYLDGQLRVSQPGAGGGAINPATDIYVAGRSDRSTSRYFGGGIDDLRLYGQALSSTDVAALAGYNLAPTAAAGADQVIHLPAATLAGTVSDDGLPNPPGACTITWSKLSGPGVVLFANASAAGTTATFSTAGTYVLQLAVSDSLLTTASSVTVSVLAPGDFNEDGNVNGADFLLWQQQYPMFAGATVHDGDANGDGKVNGEDFLVWQQNYKPMP